MAHFIFLWLVSVTLGYFSLCSLCSVPPPPFTLFTDYLTIQVLNKNEVRKWFEDYRSCRTCWTNFVKEQVTKKSVHFKIIDLHSFCIFGYKVGWFHSFPPPWLPSGKILGGGYGNTNSSAEPSWNTFCRLIKIWCWRVKCHLSRLVILSAIQMYIHTSCWVLDW